jgi:ABC-type transporter MlaC component
MKSRDQMKTSYPLAVATLIMLGMNCMQPVAAQTGKSTVDKLVQTFTSWSGNANDRQTYNEAAKYIDFRGMAERSLKPEEWKKLNPSQKNDYTSTLKTLIEERYYTRWHRIFVKGHLSYRGETNVGADTVVKTELLLGKKVDVLSWTLDTQGGERKVVSLAVGESDLLKKLSNRLEGKLNKMGFPRLLAWMRNKADIDTNEGAEQASSGTSR